MAFLWLFRWLLLLLLLLLVHRLLLPLLVGFFFRLWGLRETAKKR